jgi:hypothetical protein
MNAFVFARRTARTSPRPSRRVRRLLSAGALAIIAVVGAAGPAAADPTGQILVNGAPPRSDGGGLQVTASLSGGQLTVTNNGSSYTNAIEIDGRLADFSGTVALTGAQIGSTPCTVSAAPGSSVPNKFSCAGLSVMPGQQTTVTLSYPPTFTGGLAVVNTNFVQILVNGKVMNPNGKGLQARAIIQNSPCFSDLTHCVQVSNAASSEAPITRVDGTADSDTVTIPDAKGPFDAQIGMGCSTGATFSCETGFGMGPGGGFPFDFSFSDQSFKGGLKQVSLSYQTTPCTPNADADPSAFGPALAVTADQNCTPPSHTKITFAQVNQSKRTALFKFKAHGSKQFKCDLTRNQHVVFFNKCKSPKPYADRLKPGHYEFLVDAYNAGGIDPKPAHKKFTIH